MFNIFFLCGLLLLKGFVCLSFSSLYINNQHTREQRNNLENGDKSIFETVQEEFRDVEGKTSVNEKNIERVGSITRRHAIRKRELYEKVGCKDVKPPSNGQITCFNSPSFSQCTASCIENYKFPDGSVEKYHNCTFNGNVWSKIDHIPNCEPAKYGIGCDILSGKNQSELCITSHAKQKCTGQCIRGHRFPDGKRVMEIRCTKSDGIYVPTNKFPDCEPSDDAKDDPEISVTIIDNRWIHF